MLRIWIQLFGGRGSGGGKRARNGGGKPQKSSIALDETSRMLNSFSTNKEREKALRKYEEGTEVTIQQNETQAVYTKTYGNYWESPNGELVSTKNLVSIATVNTNKVKSRFVKVVKA